MGKRTIFLGLGVAVLFGCSESETPAIAEQEVAGTITSAAPADQALVRHDRARTAYFGELHVHTSLSFDAYIFGTRSTPDTAYEFAKGKPLAHPAGFDMEIAQPLDFLAVTDHAMYLGMLPAMDQPDTLPGQHPIAVAMRAAETPAGRIAAFQRMQPYVRQQLDGPDDLLDKAVVRSAWEHVVAAAERHNDPGTFTTFIAYEYTARGQARENLHRNVIFRGAGPELPFSSMDSMDPEDLWDWMDGQRATGIEALAIPHNSNGSNASLPTKFMICSLK